MEFRFTVHNNIGTRIVNVHPFKCESVNDFAETFDRLEAKIVDVSNVILMIHLQMFCQTIAKDIALYTSSMEYLSPNYRVSQKNLALRYLTVMSFLVSQGSQGAVLTAVSHSIVIHLNSEVTHDL